MEFRDVWERLSAADKPIWMYGTGDGADKILRVFSRYGIPIAGFFASDGFVRDRTFHGMKVLSYSEAKERCGEGGLIAVVAFASRLEAVLANIRRIAAEEELYAPDVPVAGDTLFSAAFVRLHRTELEAARSMLADAESRRVFDHVVRYKLSGDVRHLWETENDPDDIWHSILRPSQYKSIADLGAYTGDTIAEASRWCCKLSRVYAFEPDPRSYAKLSRLYGAWEGAELHQACAWHEVGTVAFPVKGSRGSGSTRSGKMTEARADTLDHILNGRSVDYIKYDVEGAEAEAVQGSAETIRRHKPDLCVSLYHRTEDIYRLVHMIHELNPAYKLYIRRFRYVPAWDLNLYAVQDHAEEVTSNG